MLEQVFTNVDKVPRCEASCTTDLEALERRGKAIAEVEGSLHRLPSECVVLIEGYEARIRSLVALERSLLQQVFASAL